jgi:hypothetical protein
VVGRCKMHFRVLVVSRSYCDDCSSVFVVYSGGEAGQEVSSKLQQRTSCVVNGSALIGECLEAAFGSFSANLSEVRFGKSAFTM